MQQLELEIPATELVALEFPGIVPQRSTLPLNVATVLGGHQRIAANLQNATYDLRFSQDPFAHPIVGEAIQTGNILVRVDKLVHKVTGQVKYEFTVVGRITKTFRFRALCDFQYSPPANDPMVKLRAQMTTLDTALLNSPSPEETPIDQCTFAPPSFSTVRHPLQYKFKQNTNLKSVAHDDDGEQLINISKREKTLYIKHDFKSPAPTAPTAEIVADGARPAVAKIVAIIKDMFDERPIWSRLAVESHIPFWHNRVDLTNALAQIAYVGASGPYRLLWIKYGVDPRVDKQLRTYQIVDFKNRANIPRRHPSFQAKRQEEGLLQDVVKPYIFDGASTNNVAGFYQLCDIFDPELHKLIHSIMGTRTTFSVSETN
jgi:general transcription factor 3C polypeptide 5 (transcription factor C subunit 1)